MLRGYRYPLEFGELRNPRFPAEASIARRLCPAERHLCFIVYGGSVDMADARLDALRNPHGA